MVNPPELRGDAFISINFFHLVDEKRYGKLINRDIYSSKIYDNCIIKKKDLLRLIFFSYLDIYYSL